MVLLRQVNKLIIFDLATGTQSYTEFQKWLQLWDNSDFIFFFLTRKLRYLNTSSQKSILVPLSNQVPNTTTVLAGPSSSVPDSDEKYKLSQLLCYIFWWAQSIKPALVSSFQTREK